MSGVPDLDDVAGEWVDAADLAHLPSLRNQWGQGHVNDDLTSLSWLTAPPYTFGYHTGVLRLDGRVLDTQRFRWKPWGVQREHVGTTVTVRTDTRMALAANVVLWRIDVVNRTDATVECTIAQDLFAMLAVTDTGWGWLYDVPWTSGNYHDFMTLERIRRTTRAEFAGPPYALGRGTRSLRLGRPRLPGIQREADTEPMSLGYELPRHVTADTHYPHVDGASATIRRLQWRDGDQCLLVDAPAEIVLHPMTEIALGAFELRATQHARLELRVDTLDQTGIVFTHGNHPDSLQLGVDGGWLWIGIAGEKAYAAKALEIGRWHEVEIAVSVESATLRIDGTDVAATGHWINSARWTSALESATVSIADQRSPARATFAFDAAPTHLERLGSGARASWTCVLSPHESRSIGVACAYGTDAADVAATAAEVVTDFDAALAANEQGYREHWRAMFTPGNTEFSGHLPTLEANDAGVAKSYYMGALVALYMRNVNISASEPIFLTGGPRLGPTTTYFWDHTEWSRLYALLEPVGLRSWLLRALAQPYDRCFGFDALGGGPLGNSYASNDYALFRLIEHYITITGDRDVLGEVAGSRSVLQHLRDLAHGWRRQRTAATGDLLADFGRDPWRLLECVPNYVNVVASLNAAYVGMMRSLASLLASLGRDDEAHAAAVRAEALAEAVLDMYVPGGRWHIRHPESIETIGHCLDFGLVAAHLHADLSPTQRQEMSTFVEQHLLSGTWMRALSLDDPMAPLSDRPDHGATGAFCAWPGVTAHGLAKLGRTDLASRILSVAHASTSGALWGQAMEIMDDDQGSWARVAEDGVSNRDSIAGAATAEAVLSALFDFNPSFRATDHSPLTTLHVPGVGVLSNINIGTSRIDSTSSKI